MTQPEPYEPCSCARIVDVSLVLAQLRQSLPTKWSTKSIVSMSGSCLRGSQKMSVPPR